MSGGHWDHQDARAFWDLKEVINSEDFQNLAGDQLAIVADQINEWLHSVTHEVDWHFSSDTIIEDVDQWRSKKLDHLRNILDSSRCAKVTS